MIWVGPSAEEQSKSGAKWSAELAPSLYQVHQVVHVWRGRKQILKRWRTAYAENHKYQLERQSMELDISRISVWWILKNDTELCPYKKIMEPSLSDDQRVKRKKFTYWLRTNFRKADSIKILFSDEKYFDIDGVYNSQNDRVWAVNPSDADEEGGVKHWWKHPEKVMVWLGACSKGITPLVILNEGAVDHTVYIEKVLPVGWKYENQVLSSD